MEGCGGTWLRLVKKRGKDDADIISKNLKCISNDILPEVVAVCIHRHVDLTHIINKINVRVLLNI